MVTFDNPPQLSVDNDQYPQIFDTYDRSIKEKLLNQRKPVIDYYELVTFQKIKTIQLQIDELQKNKSRRESIINFIFKPIIFISFVVIEPLSLLFEAQDEAGEFGCMLFFVAMVICYGILTVVLDAVFIGLFGWPIFGNSDRDFRFFLYLCAFAIISSFLFVTQDILVDIFTSNLDKEQALKEKQVENLKASADNEKNKILTLITLQLVQ